MTRYHRGVDVELGLSVVVKVIRTPADDPHAAARWLAAAEKQLNVRHPNLIPVLRAGIEGPWVWASFERIEGEDLERATRRERKIVPAAAFRAILDAAEGLDNAQQRGLSHGDLRPRHLLRSRGRTRVADLALSEPFFTEHNRRLVGHPAYLAPELVQGRAADARSDMYSLGCALFELLTGSPPFGVNGADALVACHVHDPFPSLGERNVSVDEQAERFLERLTSKRPEARFESFAELVRAGLAVLPSLRNDVGLPPELVVEDGRQAGLRVPIPEGELLLGRVPGEGVQIDDGRCSRRHAVLRRRGSSLEIEDLGSRNGIRVNGADVRSRQLFPGDRVAIGDTVMRIEGQTSPVPKIPVLPPSPIRGAFGAAELTRSPARQAKSDLLTAAPPRDERHRTLIEGIAPLLASSPRNLERLRDEIVDALAESLEADAALIVRVVEDKPVFDARTSKEADVLSCIFPAVERALPGKLSLATTVRVGAGGQWSVLLAPVLREGNVTALVVLARVGERFDERDLDLVEACCSLWAERAAPRSQR